MKKVLVLVNDLFFRSKIKGLCAGYEVVFAMGVGASLDYGAVVVDLSDEGVLSGLEAWLSASDNAEQWARLTSIGYFPHVKIELKNRAKTLGFTHAIPNSAVERELPRLLSGEEE